MGIKKRSPSITNSKLEEKMSSRNALSKSELKYNHPVGGRSFQNTPTRVNSTKKSGLLMNIPEDGKLTKTTVANQNMELKPSSLSQSRSPRRKLFPHNSLQMEHGARHSHAADDLSVCTDERSMCK